jgi:3-ketosteroid 9alpha-monooxygenase subunit B
MIDPNLAGVSEADWQAATASCIELRVREVIEETRDAKSIVLEVPDDLVERFRYQPGQFLSFKFPFEGAVLTRSYSLASSPHTDAEHKVTVKRVDDGRISNLLNDSIATGSTLMVVPPAGLFVLNDTDHNIILFGGGSGITPVISIIKSALDTMQRPLKLVYANRDEHSIIFRRELDALAERYADRFEMIHSLDARDGFLDRAAVKRYVGIDTSADFYLCGPGPFMATVEEALRELHVDHDRIHIERFVSPPDPGLHVEEMDVEVDSGAVEGTITILLDGESREVPYENGEKLLWAAREAGLEPPFSCEEGYCSCCMAKLTSGEIKMDTNDCLTQDLLEEGWILTCQARAVRGRVKIEYPD